MHLPPTLLELEATESALPRPAPLMVLQPESTGLVQPRRVSLMPLHYMILEQEAMGLVLLLLVPPTHHPLTHLQPKAMDLVQVRLVPPMALPLTVLEQEATAMVQLRPVPRMPRPLMVLHREAMQLLPLRLVHLMPLLPTILGLEPTETVQLNPGITTLRRLAHRYKVQIIISTLGLVLLISPRLLTHTTAVRLQNHTVQHQPRVLEPTLPPPMAWLHRTVLLQPQAQTIRTKKNHTRHPRHLYPIKVLTHSQ